MKRDFSKLAAFLQRSVKEHICLALICIFFYVFYRGVTKNNPTAIKAVWLILLFAFLYGCVMTVCWFGLEKFMQHERSHTLTPRRLFGYSFLVAAPVYFLWLLFAFIPLSRIELWMLTGLPVFFLTGLTLVEIADRWRGKRLLYWSMQAAVCICLLLGGQVTVNTLLA